MGTVWTATPPSAEDRAAYADAEPRSFWLDATGAREPLAPLTGRHAADLLAVGGGFTGL